MEIIKTTLNSKKDAINASNASGVLKDHIGETLTMTGAVIYSEIDRDGVEHVVTSIKTDKGFIGSTSANVRNTVEMIADEWSSEELSDGVQFTIRSAKSKNGREFLSIELV
nr:MAG TPA: ssDNA binding protein [Caudoviricetes sp.]